MRPQEDDLQQPENLHRYQVVVTGGAILVAVLTAAVTLLAAAARAEWRRAARAM